MQSATRPSKATLTLGCHWPIKALHSQISDTVIVTYWRHAYTVNHAQCAAVYFTSSFPLHITKYMHQIYFWLNDCQTARNTGGGHKVRHRDVMEDLLTEPLLPPSISTVHTTEMLEAERVSIVTFNLLRIVLYTATSGFGLPLIQPSVFLIHVGLHSHQSL